MKIRNLKSWTFRILLVWLLPLSQLNATHIVGGEIEFVRQAKYTYDIRLILYFDQINGSPAAEDNSVNIGIFSKTLNSLIDTFLLPKTYIDFVQYSYPDCAIPSISTKRIIYSRIVTLDSFTYSEPGGYYLAWDRCCRNSTIHNLVDPGSQGQLFYLEIPPIYKNGREFINSTPVLFPPVSDYACVGNLFYFDFQGFDNDGDSLVYSLVNPRRGLTGAGQPIFQTPLPGPYPDVDWAPGFGLNNMINGNPPLNISSGGFLTVRPSVKGLFVFGVKCEEYRNGTKIGEVRRDFQIFAENCPSNDPPNITGTDPISNSSLSDGDTVEITISDRCFDIEIWDPDTSTSMSVEVIALNFDSTFIFPAQRQATAIGLDTISTQICFSNCAITEDEPYEFWVIVADDGCALPKKDTLKLFATVEGFGFQVPGIFSDMSEDTLIGYIGEPISFDVFGVDNQNDTIELILTQSYWDPFYLGASFPRAIGTDTIISSFSWVPDCRALDIDSSFLIFKSFDHICTNYDSLLKIPFELTYRQYDPLIRTSLESDQVEVELLEPFEFDVLVSDSNSSEVVQIYIKVLDMDGNTRPPGPFDYNPKTDIGELQSLVRWEPGCDFLLEDTVILRIMSYDNGCIRGYDSLDLEATFTYTNEFPQLSIEGVDTTETADKELSLLVNPIDTLINLKLLGYDGDGDLILLSATGDGFSFSNLNMSFEGRSGFETANGNFEWRIPGCQLLAEESPLDVIFRIKDNSCEVVEDSLTVHFSWENPWDGLDPPNVLTPNGDGLNDDFSLDQIKAPCKFYYVVIYNRWGEEVYYTEDPSFRWHPEDLPSGQYMYHMVFENLENKGFLTILK